MVTLLPSFESTDAFDVLAAPAQPTEPTDPTGTESPTSATPTPTETDTESPSPTDGGSATTPEPTDTATEPTQTATSPDPSETDSTATQSPTPTQPVEPSSEPGTDDVDGTETETGEQLEVPTVTVPGEEASTGQGTSTPFVWNTPPAVSTTQVPTIAIVLAAVVLVALALGVALFRRGRDGEEGAPDGAAHPGPSVRQSGAAAGQGGAVAGHRAESSGRVGADSPTSAEGGSGDPWVGAAAAAVTQDATEILDTLADPDAALSEAAVSDADGPQADGPQADDPQADDPLADSGAHVLGSVPAPRSTAAGAAAGEDADEGEDAHAQSVSNLLVVLGEALLDCASPVAEVRRTLEAVADVNGIGKAEVIALPTVILVTIPGSRRTYTLAASAGARSYRLDQVGEVLTIADRARSGRLAPVAAVAQLRAVAHQRAPHPTWFLTLGYIVYSVGLSLILGGSLLEVLVTAGLGAVLGILQLATARTASSLQALVVLVGTFVVSAAVFALIRLGVDISILPSLVPPLVMFLPGALLTTAFIDLSTRQMIAGSARLAAGGMQLVLLALGITAAGHLVGVRSEAIADASTGTASALAPWLGLLIFLIGVQMYQCVPRRMMPWVGVVTFSAYAGQVLGGVFFGGIVSALVGAAVMTPLAMYASTVRGGPPTLVSFLPAFWVLVPGALGLIGVTQALDDDPTTGTSSLISAAVTMVAISLGVLVGVAAYGIGSAIRNRTSVVVPLLFVRDERLGGYLRRPDAGRPEAGRADRGAQVTDAARGDVLDGKD